MRLLSQPLQASGARAAVPGGVSASRLDAQVVCPRGAGMTAASRARLLRLFLYGNWPLTHFSLMLSGGSDFFF